MLETDMKKVMLTYDRVWGTIERVGLPTKRSKSERPHKDKQVTILRIGLDKKG